MIDLRHLKATVQSDSKLQHSALSDILSEQPDDISEEQYLTLVPILLKFGKPQEVLA